jgi:hypothetical protein
LEVELVDEGVYVVVLEVLVVVIEWDSKCTFWGVQGVVVGEAYAV